MKQILTITLIVLIGTAFLDVPAQTPAPGNKFPTHTGISTITQSTVSKDTIIKWSENRKLSWLDFLGKPPAPLPYPAASAVDIDFTPKKINGEIKFDIYAGFHVKSYATTNSESCLAHEQLHFDLCEVYARMMRKYIASFNGVLPLSEDGADMMNHCLQSHREMMKSEGARYDIETNHGKNKAKQEEWNQYIGKRLIELQKYKYIQNK